MPVVATGLAGGRTGTRLVEELTAEAILNDFVRIGEESRTSTAVVDPTESSYTEINQRGSKVTEDELEMLLDKLHYLSRGADFVVFAGSLPRGVAESFCAEAIRDLSKRGVPVVLDTEGEPLRLGTEAEPYLVSPNQREAEHVVGGDEDPHVARVGLPQERSGRTSRTRHSVSIADSKWPTGLIRACPSASCGSR